MIGSSESLQRVNFPFLVTRRLVGFCADVAAGAAGDCGTGCRRGRGAGASAALVETAVPRHRAAGGAAWTTTSRARRSRSHNGECESWVKEVHFVLSLRCFLTARKWVVDLVMWGS